MDSNGGTRWGLRTVNGAFVAGSAGIGIRHALNGEDQRQRRRRRDRAPQRLANFKSNNADERYGALCRAAAVWLGVFNRSSRG
jgi:hypothetical protein